MLNRRKDFMKLVILALIVVLALSIHVSVKHVMVMMSPTLSQHQMLSANIAYIVITALTLWILKTINNDRASQTFP